MKKTLFSILVILSMVPVIAYAAGKDAVKIAVAANSKDAAASISNKAGKCPYYLIFDSKGELMEVVDNPYKDAQSGAGSQTADFLANKGVTIVIAETFGEKMIEAMRSNGTDYFQLQGAINDAIKEDFKPRQPDSR